MPNTFKFQPKQVVNSWVDSNDTKAMIEHPWELWGGLSTEVTQKVDGREVHCPTFENWVDEFTVFPQTSPFGDGDSRSAGPGSRAVACAADQARCHGPSRSPRRRCGRSAGAAIPLTLIQSTVRVALGFLFAGRPVRRQRRTRALAFRSGIHKNGRNYAKLMWGSRLSAILPSRPMGRRSPWQGYSMSPCGTALSIT